MITVAHLFEISVMNFYSGLFDLMTLKVYVLLMPYRLNIFAIFSSWYDCPLRSYDAFARWSIAWSCDLKPWRLGVRQTSRGQTVNFRIL